MRRVMLLFMVTALAVPATAAAKGADSATISGPGLAKPIVLKGDSEMGQGTPLGMLAMAGGAFAQMFAQSPDPRFSRSPARPKGQLGPKYRVVYALPAPNRAHILLRQDLYPYAKPVPITYMRPGQVFWDQKTVGGWVRGSVALRKMLIRQGLPASSPVSSAGFWSPGLLGGAAACFALLAFAVVGYRLRRQE